MVFINVNDIMKAAINNLNFKSLIFLLLGLTNSLDVLAQDGVMNQGAMVSKDVYYEIKYDDTRKEIFQPVKLMNKSYNFFLDTGAPLSISKEIQESKKYPILHIVPLKDAEDNSDTIKIVLIDTLSFGNIVFQNIPALVLDFKNSPIGCQNIDGIIGSNVVRFLALQFDVLAKKIIFTDQKNKIKISKSSKSIPITLDNQSNAFIPISFKGGYIDTAHFDSGMGKLYDMNFAIAKENIEVKRIKPNSIYKGFGSTGQGLLGSGKPTEAYMIFADIFFGEITIKNSRISTTSTVSRFGRDLFNYGILTVDYINKELNFEPYEKRINKVKHNFGVDFLIEDNAVKVSIVWGNTKAQKRGISENTNIIKINGYSFDNKNSCEIEDILFKELAKERIKITYLINGKKRNISLTKID